MRHMWTKNQVKNLILETLITANVVHKINAPESAQLSNSELQSIINGAFIEGE